MPPQPEVEILEPGATSPVGALYLRSFAQESQCFVIGSKEKYSAYAPSWTAGLTDSYDNVHLTFEQYFRGTLTEAFGPFVALGSPEDYLPPEGAIRLYAKDADWTQRLDDLARRAVCILVEVGHSENLRWEFEHLRREGLQRKLFVLTQPSHEDAKLTWMYRGMFWRLKGNRPVRWRDFSRDLGQLGYDLNFDDPGPGCVISFDEKSRGVLLTAHADLPPEFVEPIEAWLASGKLIGRYLTTQCLSCGRRFHTAASSDGQVRDRFCPDCDLGLTPAVQLFRRMTPLSSAVFGGALFVVVQAAPEQSC
jgi:hypothetical protein